jgi:iron complex transport system ATP-binding protein
MLARAICQDTDIMILDEPTSFLDVQFKLDILSIIRKLAKEKNKAVVMSIHELEFVPAVADTVIGIYDNCVYKIGTPDDILTGENLQVMYSMASGEGKIMADGLWQYAKALERLICQK